VSNGEEAASHRNEWTHLSVPEHAYYQIINFTADPPLIHINTVTSLDSLTLLITKVRQALLSPGPSNSNRK
jgi:hypothetical protein